jgi:hypothetical protein
MRKQTNAQVPQLSTELANADLGDERLSRRLGRLVDRMSERPSDSFPKAMDDAELEAAYRFFGNERVTPEAILEPHLRATTKRARAHERITVIHDTTEFEFPGEAQREGLGRLLRPGQGFFGHFALAASADGKRLPLGLLGLKTIFRVDKPIGHKNWERSKSRGESARWRELVGETEQRLSGTHAIHVMDREGDSYATLSAMHDQDWLFVIRSRHDRRLVEGDVKLWDTAREAARIVEREVALSPRPKIDGPKGKRHPTRRARLATLSLAAAAVELPRTVDAEGSSATMKINVVHVIEVDTPRGETPVEWILVTNLPTSTADEIEFVVDSYRTRWLIEEFFKALKTGCQYEKRQLESKHSLLNALAILAPVAWRLLLMRHLARHAPEAPAQDALTPTQLEVLKAVSKKPLPRRATVREALLAVAKLGGHLTNNGDPGWIVLGRGFHDLLIMELAWRAARSDQS